MSPHSHKLNNDITIAGIGFGTWQLADGRETLESVKSAIATGYRLIDTARIYGNEASVGKAVNESGVPREDVFVTTKVWNDDHSYDKARQAFSASLKRLDLDYIDLYLIHWPNGGQIEDTWKALSEIYESGKAKAVGVSNFSVTDLEDIISGGGIVPAVNQVEFHPYVYDVMKPVLDYCTPGGILVEAYSPLSRGRGLDNEVISQIAAKYSKTNAQIMLRWCIQHGTVPIPKSTSPQHIKSNFDVFGFELSNAEMTKLNKLSRY